MTNWQSRHLELAQFISTWSKDPSTKVGAVLFREDGSIISMGYNGFPRGVKDDPKLMSDRGIRLKMTLHAEVNAILAAGRNGTNLSWAQLAVTRHPCSQCAAQLSQAGIKYVRYISDPDFEERWADDITIARNIFRQTGVKLVKVSPEG